MITACKDYITECGMYSIWDIEYEVFEARCQGCVKLNHEYQKCFMNTKRKIERSADERQFDFSETYIFGKINSFVRRIEKLLELMRIWRAWSSLERSRIEGIEMLNAKLQFLVTTVKKKSYDYLDYRKSDFDSDFEEFKSSITDLEVYSFSEKSEFESDFDHRFGRNKRHCTHKFLYFFFLPFQSKIQYGRLSLIL